MKHSFYLLFALVTLLLWNPEGMNAQDPENPVVRGVQLVSDAPPADIYLDDITPATFQNVTFLSSSRLLSISPGMHNLKVAPAGTSKDAAILDQSFTFNADSGYVLIATGKISTFDLAPVLLRRSATRLPAPGMTLVRIFHGSPGVGSLQVSIVDLASGNTEFSSVGFRENTDFRSIPGGASRVYVRNGNGDTLFRATGTLATGGVITLITSGDPGSDDFRINVLAERGELASNPMPALKEVVNTELGRIRVVNFYEGDGGGLDVTLGSGGSTTLPGMAYSSASEILNLPSGEIALTITPAGGATPIYEGTLNVIGGLYRAAYIVGSNDNSSEDVVVLTADATSRPGLGEASVRLLNAYSDSAFFPVWIRYADGSEKHIPLSSFEAFTSYDKVRPGSLTVRFNESSSTPPVHAYDINADTLYTVVIAPGEIAQRSVFIVNDDLTAAIPDIPEFSVLLSVSEGPFVNVARLAAYPTPTSGMLHIATDPLASTSGDVVVNIIDSRGVRFRTIRLTAGQVSSGRCDIDCSSLPAGVYQLVVADAEEVIGISRITVVH